MWIQPLIKPFVTLAMVWTFLAFGLVPAYGQDTKEPKCTGKYKGGEIPTKEDLAKILQAHEEWVDSRGAKGKKADLCEANLRGANLEKAFLNGANLQEASLFQANLQQAFLRGANLQKAVLAGANLTDVKNLTQAQLNQACVDENTKLPKGLTRPKPCSEEELGPKRTLGLSSTFLWCE